MVVIAVRIQPVSGDFLVQLGKYKEIFDLGRELE